MNAAPTVKPSLVRSGTGQVALKGDLTLNTVTDLIDAGQAAVRDADGTLSIDLSQVGVFSSAGVALLLNWLRLAETERVALSVVSPPADMQAIVALCDLDELFAPLLAGQS